jgi:hypothetical protein
MPDFIEHWLGEGRIWADPPCLHEAVLVLTVVREAWPHPRPPALAYLCPHVPPIPGWIVPVHPN